MDIKTQAHVKSMIRRGLTAPQIGDIILHSSNYVREKTRDLLGESFSKMLMKNAKERQAKSRKYANFWGRSNGIKG